MHAVHKLFQYRKSLSTSPYKSRGHKLVRCNLCQLGKEHCVCALKPITTSESAFLLLMYDTEVLKPSNTGKLIADLIPNTFAFLWSRTTVEDKLLQVLNDPQWQPFVIFPAEYAKDGQQVFQEQVQFSPDKKPLFILLDGSWREAKKMFRKSPYLNAFPVLSIDPQQRVGEHYTPKYQMRSSAKANQMATAEVAAHVLSVAGEEQNAKLLDCWFDVYSYQYQKSVCQTNKGDPTAQSRLEQLVGT